MVPVRLKGYIEPRSIISLIHYFYLKKGLCDISMLYNGAGFGLNGIVWAPQFGLPTVRPTLRILLPGYSQCNLEIGKISPNFLLNDTVKQMPGVDIYHVQSKAVSDAEWEKGRTDHWGR